MSEGYVKIYRSIMDNTIWDDKPYSKGQAWVDLILRANHKDGKFLIGNQEIIIKRGELVTSILQLSEDWGWSRKKVSSFLDYMEVGKYLAHQRNNKYTHIKLCQYCVFQDDEMYQEHKKNIKRTSTEHQKHTNNNDKNDKKVVSGEKSPPNEQVLAMQKRQKDFGESLIPFVETYGAPMIRKFYNYWSEPNKSQTKMRYELEKTWELKRRLDTWKERDDQKSFKNTPAQTTTNNPLTDRLLKQTED